MYPGSKGPNKHLSYLVLSCNFFFNKSLLFYKNFFCISEREVRTSIGKKRLSHNWVDHRNFSLRHNSAGHTLSFLWNTHSDWAVRRQLSSETQEWSFAGPEDRRESQDGTGRSRAHENWGEDKKARGGGEKERMGRKRGDYKQPIVQKSARPLAASVFWLASFDFFVKWSLRVGISSFSIVLTAACSFKNVLKLKPQ